MIDVLAKILLDADWKSWNELLDSIEIAKEQGWAKPLSFAFVRMYDETPQQMGTYCLGEQGEKLGEVTTVLPGGFSKGRGERSPLAPQRISDHPRWLGFHSRKLAGYDWLDDLALHSEGHVDEPHRAKAR